MADRQTLLNENAAIVAKIYKIEQQIILLEMNAEITKKDLELQLLQLYRDQRIVQEELRTAPF